MTVPAYLQTPAWTTQFSLGVIDVLAAEGPFRWSPVGYVQESDESVALTIRARPDRPGTLLAVSTTLLTEDPSFPDSEFNLQLWSRSAVRSDPRHVEWINEQAVRLILGRWPLTLPTGIQVGTLVPAGSSPTGVDASDRWGWASNFTGTAYRPTIHRL